MNYANPTTQTQAREDQVVNPAGGYTFALDKRVYLDRFLILGAAGNTYYTEQRELVEATAKLIVCITGGGGHG